MAPWTDFSMPPDLILYVLTNIKMPERKVSKNEAVVMLIMCHTVASESQTECPQPARERGLPTAVICALVIAGSQGAPLTSNDWDGGMGK